GYGPPHPGPLPTRGEGTLVSLRQAVVVAALGRRLVAVAAETSALAAAAAGVVDCQLGGALRAVAVIARRALSVAHGVVRRAAGAAGRAAPRAGVRRAARVARRVHRRV